MLKVKILQEKGLKSIKQDMKQKITQKNGGNLSNSERFSSTREFTDME